MILFTESGGPETKLSRNHRDKALLSMAVFRFLYPFRVDGHRGFQLGLSQRRLLPASLYTHVFPWVHTQVWVCPASQERGGHRHAVSRGEGASSHPVRPLRVSVRRPGLPQRAVVLTAVLTSLP